MPRNSNNAQWTENKSKYRSALEGITDAISAYRSAYKNENLNQIGWWFHSSSTNLNGWSASNTSLRIENESLIFNAGGAELNSPQLTTVPPLFAKQSIGQDAHRYFKIRCKATTKTEMTLHFKKENSLEEAYFVLYLEGGEDYKVFEVDMSGFSDWSGKLEKIKITTSCELNSVVNINYLIIDRICTFYDPSYYKDNIKYLKLYAFPESKIKSYLTKDLIEGIRSSIQSLNQTSALWQENVIGNKTSNTHEIFSDIKAKMSEAESRNYEWQDDCDAYTCVCNQTCYEQGRECACDGTCYQESSECGCDGECHGDAISCTCDLATYGFDCPCNTGSECNGYVPSCSCDTYMTCSCYTECYGYSSGCDCDGECYGNQISCSCDFESYGFDCPCNDSSICNADSGSGCNQDWDLSCTCYNECYGYSENCSCDGDCYGQSDFCNCDFEAYGFSCPCNTSSECNADGGTCNCDTHMTCTCYSECYGYSQGCECDGECYEQGGDCTCDGTCYGQSYDCQCDQEKYQETCWTCHNYIP